MATEGEQSNFCVNFVSRREEIGVPACHIHFPEHSLLEGIASEEEVTSEPVEQQKWPTQPKSQLAAIRDLLRTSSGEWTINQIASQFTGRNTQKKLDAIRKNCDRLEMTNKIMNL
jgi:hypothetical protein